MQRLQYRRGQYTLYLYILVIDGFNGCANPNFIHDKLVHIRKSCFDIAKGKECTKEGCKWAHDHLEVRRDIARMRKLTAARYQALEHVAMATTRKANPKRGANKERQAAKRKVERETASRNRKIAK